MNLVRHIVAKDTRRLAASLALWLGLLAAGALWMRWATWSGAADAAEAQAWIKSTERYARLFGAVTLVALVGLVGALVHEDRVAGSAAFWQTRPISRGRLLAAKTLGAALLFVVLPLVVLVPVWAACGAGGAELARLAGATLAMHGGIVLGALALAALTHDTGQHLFAALTACGLTVLAVTFLPAPGGAGTDGLALAAVGVAAVTALVWQFLTRRTPAGWAILLSGALVAVAALSASRWRPERPELSAEPAPAVTLQALVTPANRNVPHALFLAVAPPAGTPGLVAPWAGAGVLRWKDGAEAPVHFEQGGLWGDNAAMRVAGLRPGSGPLPWGMAVHVGQASDARLRSGDAEFSGEISFVPLAAEVLYELPLRAGAEARRGAGTTRIVDWTDDAQPTLLIEEHDAHARLPGLRAQRRRDEPVRDCFLLVQRERGVIKALHVRDLGGATAGGLRVSLRALETSPHGERAADGRWRELPGWRENAVLVKVRFTRGDVLTHAFGALPLVLKTEEEKR